MSPTAVKLPPTVEVGSSIVTTADALAVGSATLVAITAYVPNVVGAVYTPELVINPPVAPT
jgi:hypothetical protein